MNPVQGLESATPTDGGVVASRLEGASRCDDKSAALFGLPWMGRLRIHRIVERARARGRNLAHRTFVVVL